MIIHPGIFSVPAFLFQHVGVKTEGLYPGLNSIMLFSKCASSDISQQHAQEQIYLQSAFQMYP